MALIYNGYLPLIQGKIGYNVALQIGCGKKEKLKIPLFWRDFSVPTRKDC